LEDQIVWGRSPVRLDLAGGWSDTPPYCLEYGGCVVNLAANLNGQPPIQVFARICEKPEIVLRSIDLGIDERITTYEELHRYGVLGSGFGIARAALALAGFEQRFHVSGGYPTLREQLMKDFGGGVELSMLAAIPKGSGLGTSSILAATLLGTLSELCGLYWNSTDIYVRTMALEQMLTSGGGWQDQVGGISGGLKLIETLPGLSQEPVIRKLPEHFMEEQIASGRVLLYYTGITRVAHDILGDIVRSLFLNSSRHLGLIRAISENARFTVDAVQRSDWPAFCEAVRRSWILNQRLDSGTNPETVQAILDRIGDDTEACKLLGAGGGGYLLILARDAEAGVRIREKLMKHPPNARARFVDVTLSRTGFQVTRS
jgi:galactokinase/mevalonate kinase-like predicted kinase